MNTCIYCERPFPTAGAGDHVIPSALGEFRNDVRFHRICPECNSKIGKAEQQMVQCGPEAEFRRDLSPAKPAGRHLRGRSSRGAHGAPAPEYLAIGGVPRQVVRPHPTLPGTAVAVDQAYLAFKDGTDFALPLFENMTKDNLLVAIEKLGKGSPTDVYLNCDIDRMPVVEAIFAEAFPESTLERNAPTPAGVYPIKVRVDFTVRRLYFQALAKIAFHYYLCHNQHGLIGDEDNFEPIRGLIKDGGDHSEVVVAKCIVIPRSAANWIMSHTEQSPDYHVLTVRELHGWAEVFVALFAYRTPHGYLVRLRVRDDVPNSTTAQGHIYRYDAEQPESGFAGDRLAIPFD